MSRRESFGLGGNQGRVFPAAEDTTGTARLPVFVSQRTMQYARSLASQRGISIDTVFETVIAMEYAKAIKTDVDIGTNAPIFTDLKATPRISQKELDSITHRPISQLNIHEFEIGLESILTHGNTELGKNSEMWLILRLATELRKLEDSMPKNDGKISSFVETMEADKT